MHTYATDADRARTLFYLAAISIALGYLVALLIDASDVTIPWYVQPPAPMVFYVVLVWLTDRVLWKVPWIAFVLRCRMPSLGGTWVAEVRPSDNGDAVHKGEVTIKQDWMSITIRGYFGESRSHSISASFFLNDVKGQTITYTYINEPGPQAVNTMGMHYGTAILSVDIRDNTVLDGHYYTHHRRQTQGSLRLTRAAASKLENQI